MFPSNDAQIDDAALYAIKTESWKGNALFAFSSANQPALCQKVPYLLKDEDKGTTYILIREGSDERLRILLQQSECMLWVESKEDGIVALGGTGQVVPDSAEHRDILREFVGSMPDQEVQAFSGDRSLPEGTYLVKLTPSHVAFQKDTADHPALGVGMYRAAAEQSEA